MANLKAHDHITIEDYAIPIWLIKELRNTIRFSITRKGLMIRCPLLTSSGGIITQAKSWCKNTLVKNPAAFEEFKWKDYRNEKKFTIYGEEYNLNIKSGSVVKDKITWDSNSLDLIISDRYNNIQESKVVRSLLSKFIAKKYQSIISQRVHEINSIYFQVPIGKISLKNNRTNWGSCSSKGNINLSVRLLKAPKDVVDYVIIHELAHRIEMNHSRKFWQIVKDACPDYKKKVMWLKKNSHLCHI